MVFSLDVFGIAGGAKSLAQGQRGTVKRHGEHTRKLIGWPALAIAGWLVAIVAVANVTRATREPPLAAPFRFPIELPDSVSVANGLGIKLGLSRDGSQLAIVGMKDGRRALYLRKSDELQARLLPGTDSGFSPSFSPDGQWLLYLSAARLMKVRVAGGAPEQIVDSAFSASWGDDGFIVYQRGNALWRVSADGRDPRRIATPDANQGYRRYAFPEVLPGSQNALVTAWRRSTNLDSARIVVVSLSDGRAKDLGIRGANAHYVAPGYLVFAQVGGAVAAVPFSLRRLAVTGPVVQLLRNVWAGDGGGTDFSVSDNGLLAYHGGVPEAERLTMLTLDDAGRARHLPQIGRELFLEPRLSPDGRRMVVAIGPPPPSSTGDIWVYDLESGKRTQVSSAGVNSRPEWTADGTKVVFISQRGDSQLVVARRWDATGEPEILARGVTPAFYELAMGPASGWSAVRTGLAPGGSGIRIAPTDSFSQLRPFETRTQMVLTPRMSPNGRYVAYVVTEAGRREVVVRPVPGPGKDVVVSREGGTEPAWSRDSRTLFFRGLTHMMSAAVVERESLIVRPPVALFRDTFRLSAAHTGYDVFPSGREFLIPGGRGREQDRAYVLVNWTQAMQKARGAP
jgi:eukaryotic-like serine/threonine-protein kinase